jgi:phosphate transport system substrate-binding protein
VFGPPSTSGTRDSLAELILEKGCQSDEAMKALKEKSEDEFKATCTRIREDGKYVDSGENDNLIVQKLGANPNAVGVFGFSFLEENKDTLKDVAINGVEATYETVSTGQYPGARPLYIYVKKAHLAAIPGLQGFLNAFAANWNPDGVLTKRGMVAAPEDVRKKNADIVKALTVLDGSQLK